MIEVTMFSSFLLSFLPHIFNPHGSLALEMDDDGFSQCIAIYYLLRCETQRKRSLPIHHIVCAHASCDHGPRIDLKSS